MSDQGAVALKRAEEFEQSLAQMKSKVAPSPKLKGKIVDRAHHAKPAKSVAPSPLPPVEAEKDAPRIIRSRRYSIKPMTAEEAVLIVEESADQFLVFRDADTDRIGVIYKRKDGNYGLIEP